MAERDLQLALDGDAQTGQIWVDGAGTALPAWVEKSGYVTAALGYDYTIDDDTGTDVHVVTVRIDFLVSAGGTYTYSVDDGGNPKHGSGSWDLSSAESWHTTHDESRVVTLFFRKGPAS